MNKIAERLLGLAVLAVALSQSLMTASAQSAPDALDPNGVSAVLDPSTGNLCVTANLVSVGVDGSDLTSTVETITVTDTAGNFVASVFGTVGVDAAVTTCAPFALDCTNAFVAVAPSNDWGLGQSLLVAIALPDDACPAGGSDPNSGNMPTPDGSLDSASGDLSSPDRI